MEEVVEFVLAKRWQQPLELTLVSSLFKTFHTTDSFADKQNIAYTKSTITFQ